MDRSFRASRDFLRTGWWACLAGVRPASCVHANELKRICSVDTRSGFAPLLASLLTSALNRVTPPRPSISSPPPPFAAASIPSLLSAGGGSCLWWCTNFEAAAVTCEAALVKACFALASRWGGREGNAASCSSPCMWSMCASASTILTSARVPVGKSNRAVVVASVYAGELSCAGAVGASSGDAGLSMDTAAASVPTSVAGTAATASSAGAGPTLL